VEEQEQFNEPPSGKKARGPKPVEGNQRVSLTLEWEGTVLEARAFGRLQRHLIADLEGTPDRPLVMKLRRAWTTACERAGVANG
jgi:hypothetical protein